MVNDLFFVLSWMIFEFKWIGTIQWKQERLHFLFEADSLLHVKNCIAAKNLITTTLNSYSSSKESFGNFQISCFFGDNKSHINILVADHSLEEWIKLLSFLWYDVFDYQVFWQNHTPEEKKLFLESIIATVVEQIKNTTERKKQIEEEEKKKYDDPYLKKLLHLTQQTFDDVEELLQKTQWCIPVDRIKKIKQSVDDLKKQRMGTNTEKIAEILDSIFLQMQEIEMLYLEERKKTEIFVIPESQVSDVDVDNEYTKMIKAEKVYHAWLNQTADDKYYIFFWNIWIYQKLLGKDFLHILQNISSVFYGFLMLIYYSLIVLILWLWIFTFFVMDRYEDYYGIYTWLIWLGWLGLIMQIFQSLLVKNIFILFLYCLLVWWSFYLLFILLKINLNIL